jgi:hypothetical protein
MRALQNDMLKQGVRVESGRPKINDESPVDSPLISHGKERSGVG